MKVYGKEIQVRSTKRVELIDITSKVQEVVGASGVKEGVCLVFVPHTTAAVTLNEHADPTVAYDILERLSSLVPEKAAYRHAEGNADSHIKSSLMGSSVMVPVGDGKLLLGTWQGIFFCEFDGPRNRRVIVRVF